jgi:triphosphoribosyl-dephospho-CoA synthase
VDFLVSAAAIAPVMEAARESPVGQTILEAVRATRAVVTTNTNLGIVLLLAPLSAVPPGEALEASVKRVLNRLTVNDARAAYQAIRLAAPAGLGKVVEQDISQEPTQTLLEVMQLAADRDLVAAQYAGAFRDVFEAGVPALIHGLQQLPSLEEAIMFCHVDLMSRYPDSLIARKVGRAEAEEATRRAKQVLQAGWPRSSAGRSSLADLDAWLREAERGRNPGTISDLVTASLFVALLDGSISLPSRIPWARD